MNGRWTKETILKLNCTQNSAAPLLRAHCCKGGDASKHLSIKRCKRPWDSIPAAEHQKPYRPLADRWTFGLLNAFSNVLHICSVKLEPFL
jgi:hypothetical protein